MKGGPKTAAFIYLHAHTRSIWPPFQSSGFPTHIIFVLPASYYQRIPHPHHLCVARVVLRIASGI